MLLTVLSVKAQESVETRIFPTNQIIAPHLIEVTFSKTVHILFPSEVKYVDLGSYDIIADKATGVENVVRIKSAVKGFEGETNFSVITADGCRPHVRETEGTRRGDTAGGEPHHVHAV